MTAAKDMDRDPGRGRPPGDRTRGGPWDCITRHGRAGTPGDGIWP
ncbi:hypothetical protein ASZ90_001615 [hydrocarbon metagenome]|uniref:Uncharacterized protein n=1 Tax=hydrocarbon metagenome TaxID=938273 RepID=A0A0W8G5S5_9ZZZZ